MGRDILHNLSSKTVSGSDILIIDAQGVIISSGDGGDMSPPPLNSLLTVQLPFFQRRGADENVHMLIWVAFNYSTHSN